MDAKKVEVLLEAVESGSLMGVAERNGYTPSGLSHLLQRLEEELGVQLAERTNRGIRLSEAGERLLPYLRGYVESSAALEREAALLRGEAETVLQIGAYASIAKNWMPALLRAFAKKHPEIRVELEVLSRQELYRGMKDGRFRLIFACEDKTQPYRFLHLADDSFYAVLPPSDEALQAIALPAVQRGEKNAAAQPQSGTAAPAGQAAASRNKQAETAAAAAGNAFAIADFEKYPFIMPSYGEDVEVQEAFAQHRVHPQLLPASADDPVILGMVAGGMGVTMLSELVMRGSSEPVHKVPLLPVCARPLGIVHKEPRELSAAERSFLQFVREAYKAGSER